MLRQGKSCDITNLINKKYSYLDLINRKYFNFAMPKLEGLSTVTEDFAHIKS
jgi:hypothetical protein